MVQLPVAPAPAQEVLQLTCPEGGGPGTVIQAQHNGVTYSLSTSLCQRAWPQVRPFRSRPRRWQTTTL
eukprot:SAG31_NODE_5395_length_2564_cov_1.704260_1_plen_68_part_00